MAALCDRRGAGKPGAGAGGSGAFWKCSQIATAAASANSPITLGMTRPT
jgi:hypothetical protein